MYYSYRDVKRYKNSYAIIFNVEEICEPIETNLLKSFQKQYSVKRIR